jgi:hypothetical protein
LLAEVVPGKFDMLSVRDASTLETRVIEEWHPWEKDATVRQKLVEIMDSAANDLWWTTNRHADYTFAMEYDVWQSTPLRRTGPATFAGGAVLPSAPGAVDFVIVHQHVENGSTLTFSSPLLRMETR